VVCGPAFGVEQPGHRGHPVGLLSTQPDEPFARPFGVVGGRTVLIQQGHQPFGGFAQVLGSPPDGDPDQGVLALLPVTASTDSGSRVKKRRRIVTCSPPMRPSAWAAATLASTGISGSPFNATRGPNPFGAGFALQPGQQPMRQRR